MVQRVTRLEEWRASEERRRERREESDSEDRRTLVSWKQVIVGAVLGAVAFGVVRFLGDLAAAAMKGAGGG